MLKCDSGRKVWVSTCGRNTLEVYDKYVPSHKWQVRICQSKVQDNKFDLSPEFSQDDTYIISANRLADFLYDNYDGVLYVPIMGAEFCQFVQELQTQPAEESLVQD